MGLFLFGDPGVPFRYPLPPKKNTAFRSSRPPDVHRLGRRQDLEAALADLMRGSEEVMGRVELRRRGEKAPPALGGGWGGGAGGWGSWVGWVGWGGGGWVGWGGGGWVGWRGGRGGRGNVAADLKRKDMSLKEGGCMRLQNRP